MPGTERPIVIVVHGAWHRPIHYINIYNYFQAKGYTVRIPALTTAGRSDDVAQRDTSDDIQLLRGIMKGYLDLGKSVVLVCHSFGGFPSTGAAVGETISDRKARGEKGGVAAVVYLAAFAPPQVGVSLLAAINYEDDSQRPEWWVKEGDYAVLKPSAAEYLYSGIDEELSSIGVAAAVLQSFKSFGSQAQHNAAEISAPLTYIAAEHDKAIPFEAQKAMALAAGAELEIVPGSHSPFLDPAVTPKMNAIIEEAVLKAASQ